MEVGPDVMIAYYDTYAGTETVCGPRSSSQNKPAPGCASTDALSFIDLAGSGKAVRLRSTIHTSEPTAEVGTTASHYNASGVERRDRLAPSKCAARSHSRSEPVSPSRLRLICASVL